MKKGEAIRGNRGEFIGSGWQPEPGKAFKARVVIDRSRMKTKDILLVCLIVLTIALALFSANEYSMIQSAGTGMSLANDKGIEVVYNLQGVAIPVPCCPAIVSTFVLGQYLFQDSSVSPPNPLTVNGTTTTFESGVALVLSVSPLSNQGKSQQVEFVWSGRYSSTTPVPVNASLFGGTIVFHWYTLMNILYIHIET